MPEGESYPSSVWCRTMCQALRYWPQHSTDRACWLEAQDTQPAQSLVYKSEQVCALHFHFGDYQLVKMAVQQQR